MSVTKLTMSGFTPSTFNKYDDFLAGNAAYDPAATFLIARTSPSGVNTITFNSIPSTYKHLQIRAFSYNNSGSYVSPFRIQFNGDSSAAYTLHYLYANQTGTVTASGSTAQSYLQLMASGGGITNIGGAAIIDILDYANTSKYKTVRTLEGVDNNTYDASFARDAISLTSNAWLNTSAITSITIYNASANWNTGSTFALYGFTG